MVDFSSLSNTGKDQVSLMNARSTRSLAGCVSVLLILAASAQATESRRPTFAGLASATTCIPGPERIHEKTSYHLEWEAATDENTPPSEIVYNVYRATKPGGEHFRKPTYTTAPGVTSFDTPRLPVSKIYYFVVRARDKTGNEDANTVEREGENLCV